METNIFFMAMGHLSAIKRYYLAALLSVGPCSVDVVAMTVDESTNFMMRHQAKKPITNKEYVEAFEHYLKEARDDNHFAQYYIGEAYEFGLGADSDLKSALEWYQNAAKQQNAKAQLKIGLFYYHGKAGLGQNEVLARDWWTKAAKQNNVDALFELGLSYCYSEKLPTNCKNGVELLERAATLSNHEKAALALGELYQQGTLIQRDNQKANYWYQKAIEMDNVDAHYLLAKLYQTEKDNILGDINKSIHLYETAGRHGHVTSLYSLGFIYYKGEGVPVDYEKAYALFQEAYQLGHAKSAFALGIMYDRGLGVLEDPAKAFSYYEKASKLGSADAQKALADMYYYGSGTNKDLIKAYAWYLCSKISNEDIQKHLIAIRLALAPDKRLKADQLASQYIEQYQNKDTF